MLLRLLQLTSPSLPIGAYSYSEGLESLVESQQIASVAALEHWILQELHYGAIRVEAAIALRAHRAIVGNSGDLDHGLVDGVALLAPDPRPPFGKLKQHPKSLSPGRGTLNLAPFSLGRRAGDEGEDLAQSSTNLVQDPRANLQFWNAWLTASRETEELRQQSLQMGRSLIRLWQDLEPDRAAQLDDCDYHFAIAFGLIAAHWDIDEQSTALGYLHSWTSNLISAGIKLVPIGQTAGQRLLLKLGPVLESSAAEILGLADEDLESCGYGLALASMAHETQYSRLFRS
jgi:urease accessory protein UreF